jgi:putative ABC transport system permease protein
MPAESLERFCLDGLWYRADPPMTRIVLGTLRRRWLRTLLTGLSTLVAFILLGFFLAIRHGFAVGPVQVGADLLLLEPVGGTSGLPIGLLSTVQSFPGVRSVIAYAGEGMLYGAHRHPLGVAGLSSNPFLEMSDAVGSGELPRAQARAWLADPMGALVSAKAARQYGWRVGQSITLHTLPGTAPQDLTVHVDGVIANHGGMSYSSDVNLHLRSFRHWAHTDLVGYLFLRVRQAQQADTVARAIDLRFANSATPVHTQSFKALLQGTFERLANVNTLTSVVIVASLFGLFLICFNTEIHSVSERLGEFALLKAIGFAPPRLLSLVLLEGLLAIVPAAAAGILCALLVIRAFAREKLHLPGIALTPGALLACALIAVGLAVLATVLPGLRILRLNSAQILRRG